MGAADLAQRCCGAAGRHVAERLRAFAPQWLAALLTCVAAGPTLSREAQPPAASPAVRVVEVLHDAIAALNRPGADVHRVMTDALQALPKDAPPATGGRIGQFLGRLPAAGDDFRCGASFLRWRAMAELFRLVNAARGEPVQPIGPLVCYARPYAVDASRPPGRVEIFGFDLDQVQTEMVLVANGSYRDVSAALVRHSPTHLTLDLGNAVAALGPDDDLLGLVWGNVIHYRIPVVQPATPLCRSWVQRIEAKQLPLSPPLVDAQPPARPRGHVRAFAALDHVMNQVEANLCVSLTGARVHAGCEVQFVQTVDADGIIEGIVGAMASRLDTGAAPDLRSGAVRARAGPVRRWTWKGLGGADAPQLMADLGEITVVVSHKERCIAAVDFLEARRSGALAAATVQRLAPQVDRMPPVIRSMRPRFAPAGPR